MARKSNPQPLTLDHSTTGADNYTNLRLANSPFIATSPTSSPRSPYLSNPKRSQSRGGEQPSMQAADGQTGRKEPLTPTNTSSVSLHRPAQSAPASKAKELPGSVRGKQSNKGGFFSNYKASKSNNTIRQASDEGMSRDTDRSAMTGPVAITESKKSASKSDKSSTRRPAADLAKPEISPSSSMDSGSVDQQRPSTARRAKPKPFRLLSRSKSIRGDPESSHSRQSPHEPVPIQVTEPSPRLDRANTFDLSTMGGSLPSQEGERLDSEMGSLRSKQRSDGSLKSHLRSERSDDGQSSSARESPREMKKNSNREYRDHSRENHGRDHGRNNQSMSASSSNSSTLFNAFKSNSTKAVQNIGKGIWAKVGRSASVAEKEPVIDDEHYVLKVINLPLVEQTRLTRISKKLEKSRDKTEFWMPAFPWRAIDYLNYKGSEVEGLYRVPGSGPQIKKWQRKFDEEHDVDLFAQEDLYDINIVGSMFKAWLRELPDEIFPRACQDRISRECAGAETVPQMLIDELSNLPPFNYYLLFAVTCHLSLLLAHQDKNKMDFRNLCICFQPCMKIDRFCFRFLVENWRDCWKGCKTEQYYIEQEYALFEPPPPSRSEGRSSIAIESIDDRNVSSSESSKPPSLSVKSSHHHQQQQQQQQQKQQHHHQQPPQSSHKNKAANYNSTASSDTLTTRDPRTPRQGPDKSPSLKPLSPIKPLSPMGF